MPCPFFEPRAVTPDSFQRFGLGRFPLIDEFDGVCHRTGGLPVTDPYIRRTACNLGADDGCCAHRRTSQDPVDGFPILRFTVAGRSAASLDVTLVEESRHAPLRWHNITFFADSGALSHPLPDPCRRAQFIAFCQSYLRRFPSHS